MAKVSAHGALRRIVLEVVGWGMVVAGIAALVLPGPGLLLLAGGLIVLSQQYEWAERRVEPVKVVAFRTAAEGVQTWPRILLSATGALGITLLGVLFVLDPDVPGWWPVRESWWLPGGWAVGISLVVSGLIAAGIIVYSFVKFRGLDDPDEAAELAARRED